MVREAAPGISTHAGEYRSPLSRALSHQRRDAEHAGVSESLGLPRRPTHGQPEHVPGVVSAPPTRFLASLGGRRGGSLFVTIPGNFLESMFRLAFAANSSRQCG